MCQVRAYSLWKNLKKKKKYDFKYILIEKRENLLK